jgi:hypothetical protein
LASEQIEPVEIHAITERRFNAHVVWARGAGLLRLVKEVEWLEIKPGQVFGTVFLDLTDQDLNGAVLAPDLAGRYRGVAMIGSHTNIPDVINDIAASMARVHSDPGR